MTPFQRDAGGHRVLLVAAIAVLVVFAAAAFVVDALRHFRGRHVFESEGRAVPLGAKISP